MKINLKILNASYIFHQKSIKELDTKKLVPKMTTRRRLTKASKIAIYLASKIDYKNERIVYGSSYGELLATENILLSIEQKEHISPTQFQNSVYNIPVSYLSMLSNNTNEIVTISSDDKTSLNVLKAGAIKALDGDEIVLMVIETLNINGAKEINNCIDYLECGVALKVKASNEKANLKISDMNSLRLPPSTALLYNIAKEFRSTANIVSVKT